MRTRCSRWRRAPGSGTSAPRAMASSPSRASPRRPPTRLTTAAVRSSARAPPSRPPRANDPARIVARPSPTQLVTRPTSDRLQILDERGLVLRGEPELHHGIVVVHDIEQGREPAVVIEAALRVGPQAGK